MRTNKLIVWYCPNCKQPNGTRYREETEVPCKYCERFYSVAYLAKRNQRSAPLQKEESQWTREMSSATAREAL